MNQSNSHQHNEEMRIPFNSIRITPRKLKYIFSCLICNIIVVPIIILTFYFNRNLSLQFTLKTNSTTSVAYIITVPGYDERVPIVLSIFKKYANLDLQRFNGVLYSNLSNVKKNRLSPGENGLRATMKRFFKMIIRKNYEQVFVFEDDVIPHINFTRLFKELPNRCIEADVLLLGATMWHRRQADWPSGVCFDADNATFGAFALLIKRKSYRPILRWLKHGKPAPYDHVYPYLQRNKLIVRVAFPPFLVIADISHSSLVRNNRTTMQYNIYQRSKLHRWDLKNYPMVKISVENNVNNLPGDP